MFQARKRRGAPVSVVRVFSQKSSTRGQTGVLGEQICAQEGLAEQHGTTQ